MLPLKTPPTLDPARIQEIAQIGQLRLPSEACGVMIPTPHRGRWVWEMPNRSLEPDAEFVFGIDDVFTELEDWITHNDDHWNEIIFWHTHPGGRAYPSRADVENRVGDVHNLIVALADTGPVPCWY